MVHRFHFEGHTFDDFQDGFYGVHRGGVQLQQGTKRDITYTYEYRIGTIAKKRTY